MSDGQMMFVPSQPLPAPRTGVLTAFDPGTRDARGRLPDRAPVPAAAGRHRVREGRRGHPARRRDDLRRRFRPAGDGEGAGHRGVEPVRQGPGHVGQRHGRLRPGRAWPTAIVSGLEKFEGPDPAYWCAQGYAICNPDIRGVVDSEGDSVLWDRQEGRDCYDLIEWLAEQEWCTGKVGMSGTSYLAVAQWFTAAEQPPHLAAINPWEGVSDVYRDLVMRGGMPDIGFAGLLQDGSFFGKNQQGGHPRRGRALPADERACGRTRSRDFERHHRAGVRRGQLLEHPAHRRNVPRLAADGLAGEVAADPQQPGMARLLRRGQRRGPAPVLRPLPQGRGQRVGADARASATPCSTSQAATRSTSRRTQFPPSDVTSTKYYLDGRLARPDHRSAAERRVDRRLRRRPPTRTRCRSSPASTRRRSWSATPRRTSGSKRVAPTTWTCSSSSRSSTRTARRCRRSPLPNQSALAARPHRPRRDHPAVQGLRRPPTRLARHLDEALSTDDVPAHTFDRVEKLAPGEIVDIEIDLLPIGLAFHPGEQLRFVVSARQPARNDDARDPGVRRRQQRTARHPHRRRARLLPAAPRPGRLRGTAARGPVKEPNYPALLPAKVLTVIVTVMII